MIGRTLHRLKPAGTLPFPHPATWLALLLPVFAWAQLTYPGYFELHSGFLPIFNLNDLLLRPGNPAWAPVIGQFYDLLRGEGALPYRLAAVLGLLGAPAMTAVKTVFGASMLAGALGMYGWARRRLGCWPALLAETVYLFWPVALATVYVRGAFAEAAFLGLMPWVLWAADAAVAPGRPWSGVALALALAATLWTQTGLALWLVGIVLAYILVQAAGTGAHRGRGAATALLGWAGGMLLGAVGLLPLLLGRGPESGTPVIFADHFVYPYQLLLSGWGTGPSVAGPYDSLTFDMGVVAFSLAVLSVLPLTDLSASPWNDVRSAFLGSRLSVRRTQYIAAAFVLALILLSTTLTAWIWGLFPGLARSLTYPWQLLLLAGPWLAWLAGTGGRALAGLFFREPGTTSNGGRDLRSLSLFAALITLVLIGSYADLNPATTAGPAAESPVAIFGNNEIALLDAKVSALPGPSGRAVVSVQWQALRPLDQDYTIFVHAVTPDGTRWGQVDTMPQAGKLPTSQWRAGQVVTDQYTLTFKPDAPAGQDYRYLLGLYLWQTGQRLPANPVEGPSRVDDKVVLAP